MLWTFERDHQRICIGRRTATCRLIVIRPDDDRREYRFRDVPALLAFQADMEAFLLKTGWALMKYSPERRGGRDRRGFPRLAERRRWWTDSAALAKVVWGNWPRSRPTASPAE